jgi:hypothetical protein
MALKVSFFVKFVFLAHGDILLCSLFQGYMGQYVSINMVLLLTNCEQNGFDLALGAYNLFFFSAQRTLTFP